MGLSITPEPLEGMGEKGGGIEKHRLAVTEQSRGWEVKDGEYSP